MGWQKRGRTGLNLPHFDIFVFFVFDFENYFSLFDFNFVFLRRLFAPAYATRRN